MGERTLAVLEFAEEKPGLRKEIEDEERRQKNLKQHQLYLEYMTRELTLAAKMLEKKKKSVKSNNQEMQDVIWEFSDEE
jgi:hypothetical protein